MPHIGQHCLVEAYGCPATMLNDESLLLRTLKGAADRGGFTLLSHVSRKFQPQGVTAIGLMAESHLSIHTWPERGIAAIDAFTCGTEADPAAACQHIVECLQAERHDIQVIARGSSSDAKFFSSSRKETPPSLLGDTR